MFRGHKRGVKDRLAIPVETCWCGERVERLKLGLEMVMMYVFELHRGSRQ